MKKLINDKWINQEIPSKFFEKLNDMEKFVEPKPVGEHNPNPLKPKNN